MKTCSKCNEEKELKEYAWRNKSANKLTSNCRACQAKYHRTHYLNNKEAYKIQAKIGKQVTRAKVLDYLQDKKCIECGNSNVLVLEFHHRDRSTKSYDVSYMIMRNHSWAKIICEIEKCNVLCSNCHKILTHKENNSYRCADMV